MVVKRANEILAQLEEENQNTGLASTKSIKKTEPYQLSFFQLDDPVLSQIRDEIINRDVNNLTPIESLNKLNEIKKIITGRSDV